MINENGFTYFLLPVGGVTKLLGLGHSDGIHLFRPDESQLADKWDKFIEVFDNPTAWLRSNVDESRQGFIEENLDLQVVPLDDGYMVEYCEGSRIATIGLPHHRHDAGILKPVVDEIVSRKLNPEINVVIPSDIKYTSVHIELGGWSIWKKNPLVFLQSADLLMTELVKTGKYKVVGSMGNGLAVGADVSLAIPPITKSHRCTFWVQLIPTCVAGSENACLFYQNMGWRKVGSGAFKKYCDD